MADDFLSRSKPVDDSNDAPSVDFLGRSKPVDQTPDPDAVAHGAADMPPAQAGKALELSRATGLAPDYVAGDMGNGLSQIAKAKMASGLNASPVLLKWASQSSVHAAAVKHDVGPLGTIESWLRNVDDGSPLYEALGQGVNDIAGAEAQREQMGSGGPLSDTATAFEDEAQEYDSKPHGFAQQVARAVPQMVGYGATHFFTGGVGLAGLLYAQNKGVLARQIQQAMPNPPEVKTHLVGNKPVIDNQAELDAYNPLTKDEINNYATVGSAVSAVVLAGALTPLVRTLPGARQGLQAVTRNLLMQATTRTAGAVAIKALTAWGGHTVAGAMGMALQASINDSVTQDATKDGDIDYAQVGRVAATTFVKVLPVMATFGAYGPTRDFLEQRGRINLAAGDAAKLDAMVEQAKQSDLVKHSPDYASELFGLMGKGARVYINYKAAGLLENLSKVKVAEAQASQGDVSVPMGDYLAHMSEDHDAIKDDVKLTRDGMTMNEAREEHTRLTEALTPEEARTLYGKMSPDELQGLDVPIAADMSEPQKALFNKQGAPANNVATANNRAPESGTIPKTEVHVEGTEVTKPLHEIMADEYGGTPDEWAKRLTPELMDALNEEGSVGAVAPEEHAARVIEALPIDDIDPKQFQRIAKKANKYIQTAAEQAKTGGPAGAKKPSMAEVVALSTYELARDLNEAKAKKAEAVQAEMGKALDKLTKQATDQKLRANIFRAGSPLLHLFDAITEGTSASKTKQGWADAHNEAVSNGMAPFSPEAVDFADARMNGAMKEATEWFQQAAWPDGFDKAAVQKFLDKPKPWGELTPPEARNLMDAAKDIAKAAKEQSILRSEDGQQQVDDIASTSRAELKQNPDKGLPELTGSEPPNWWEKMLLSGNAANAVQLRLKNNLLSKSATLAKYIWDRLQQARFDRNDESRDTLAFYKEAFENMPPEIAARRYETYDLSDKLPSPKGVAPATGLTRQWVWKLARHWGSAGNVDRIASTSGWSKDVLSNILFDDPQTKLSIPEWDYLQSIGDWNETKVWPRIKEHFEDFYGQAPPKVAAVPFKVQLEDGTWKDYAGGYEPLKMDKRPGVAAQPEPSKGIASFFGNSFQAPWTPGQVKSRLDNAHYLVNMDWDTGRATMASTLHWLAFDQPVRDVAKLLNDVGLKSDMNQFMGQARSDMVDSSLKAIATQNAESLSVNNAIVQKALGANRALAVMGAVGASFRLAAAQLGHPALLMAGGKINPLYGIPSLVRIFKPFELGNGEVKLMPNWNEAIDNSRLVQDRADTAYQSLQNEMRQVGESGRQGPMGKMWAMARATAGLQLHAVDRLTTTWAWDAAHNEAVGKHGMEPLSPEAIKFADDKVFDVMPDHSIEGAAPMLSNRQLGGFIIMHGFKNTMTNLRYMDVNASVMDFHKASTAGQYVGAAANTAGRVALQMAMFGTATVLGKLALGYGQQIGEDKKTWLLRDSIGGQTSDVPFLGELGEPLAKALVNSLPEEWGFKKTKLTRHDFTMHGAPAMAAINAVYDTLGDLLATNKAPDKKAFDALESVLYLGRVPSKPVRVGAEFLYERIFGDKYDGGDAAQVGNFLYNDKQWASIKRSLSPDED